MAPPHVRGIMSISVNGQSQVPPGFRFHPTEEELLQYYLKKKVALEKIDLDVIQDVDLNKLEPWDIQEKCKIGTTPQNDWYFFSHKDKKYPTGTRTNRATSSGFWKATGRDKVIYGNSRRIGMRKTLVFYKGRAPHGQKSDWIMHEYRLYDNTTTNISSSSKNMCNAMGEGAPEEGWVVCRVFKKKNHSHKTSDSPISSTTWSISSTINSCNEEGTLEKMLQSMGTPSRRNQFPDADNNRRFLKLPSLYERPPPNSSSCRSQTCYQPLHVQMQIGEEIADPAFISSDQSETSIGIQDWAALDRLVASHLNDTSKQLSSFTHDDNDPRMSFGCPADQLVLLQQQRSPSSSSSTRPYGASTHDYQNEDDLWSFPPIVQ